MLDAADVDGGEPLQPLRRCRAEDDVPGLVAARGLPRVGVASQQPPLRACWGDYQYEDDSKLEARQLQPGGLRRAWKPPNCSLRDASRCFTGAIGISTDDCGLGQPEAGISTCLHRDCEAGDAFHSGSDGILGPAEP
mmetsp:Transcript_106217/g.307415  ORF Transcript_106217/g.307415 Transcript_106217/m.307415 type:complete len:137 (-) Transcript_106217:229-639(-)